MKKLFLILLLLVMPGSTTASMSSTALRDNYTAGAASTDFNFTFPLYAKTNISVLVNGTVQILDTDYTVRAGALPFESVAIANLPTAGFVRFIVARAGGEIISLIPTQPIVQTSEYTLEPFPAARIERDFDKGTMISRAIKEELRRALKFETKSLKQDVTVPDPVALQYLRWKSDLTGLENVAPPIASGGSVAFPITIAQGGTNAVTASAARTNLGLGTIATENTPLLVTKGGTGLAVGTSGGVPYFASTTTMASSALLTNNALMLGGGVAATPKVMASLGTTTTVLHGNAAGAPTFGAVSLTADVTGFLPVTNVVSTPGSPSTQFLRGDGTWNVPAGSGVSGSAATGNATYWSAASVLAGETTVIHAAAHGFLTGASAAANKTALNAAIAACNTANGCQLILPAGIFNIDPTLTTIAVAAVVQGAGAFSSETSGTAIIVSGAGTLFTVSKPVWFKNMLIRGGTTAIAFSTVNGGGIDGLYLATQTGNAITVTTSNAYTLRDSSIIGYTTAGVAVTATAPGDGGDATITGCTFQGAINSSALTWTGGGGLRFNNNKILVITSSTGAAISINAATATVTSDILIQNNSIEGAYAIGVHLTTTGAGVITSLLVNNNQFAGMSTNYILVNSASINDVSITGNTLVGGTAGITYILLTNLVTGIVSGNIINGNGGAPTGISVGAAATGVQIGTNKYTGLTVNVASASATTTIAGNPATTLAAIPTVANGSMVYCSDCNPASNPCSASSTGAIAKRLNGAWVCN